MLIANTGQSLVIMNLRTGEQVQLPPGQLTPLDDSKIQYIDDSFVLISLFNAGVLVAYTDAGAAYPGFPTTANPADSKRIPPVDAEYAAAVAVEAIAVADISRNPDGTVSGYTYGGASYAVTYGPFGVESITGGGRTITVAYDASGRVEEITNV